MGLLLKQDKDNILMEDGYAISFDGKEIPDCKTLLELDQLLLEAISDFISVSTTTNIAADNFIISARLNEYDMSQDDHFRNWWVYFNTTNNPKVDRRVKDYTTSAGKLEIYGAALAAETGAVTFRLSRYSFQDRRNAINRAIEEVYPTLYMPLESRELITGNILPPFNWTSATALAKYRASDVNLSKTTRPSSHIRRGDTSAKLTATGANGYLSIHSDDYPRLLDFQDKSATLKCWALPEIANDAKIEIRTKQADGTTQTLTSTTTNPAGEFSLIKVEDQDLNDDLVEVELGFYVTTDTKYVYYDPPRLTGLNIRDYILPKDFQEGIVDEVHIQASGRCDDIHPAYWSEVAGWELISDGIDKRLWLPYLYPPERQLRLIGTKKLNSLSDDADTISIDREERLSALIAYSAHRLFKMIKGVPASADITRFDRLAGEWLAEYYRLSSLFKMPTRAITMNLPQI